MIVDWSSVVGGLGFGSLIGGVITQFVSARLRHREWLNDNKKQEWRELISELSESIELMGYAFERGVARAASDPKINWVEAIGKGNRIVTGRIFIAQTIAEEGIVTKWNDLMQYVISSRNPREPHQRGGIPTANGFNTKALAFQDELIRVCRTDLAIK